jgi:hypothetical protein
VNALDISPVPTDQDVADARDAGLSLFIKIKDGTIYAPVGGGYMTSGLSTQVRMDTDNCLRRVRQFEALVRDNLEQMGSQLGDHDLVFHLQVDAQGDAFAIEETSRTLIRLGPFFPRRT